MMFRWGYSGTTIVDYLSLFEECLDVPQVQANGFIAEVQTHLEDAAAERLGMGREASQESRRKIWKPGHCLAAVARGEEFAKGSPRLDCRKLAIALCSLLALVITATELSRLLGAVRRGSLAG
jgi:hypothetical protein